MRAVHVGIGRQDDLVIAEVSDIEGVADSRAERQDQVLDLFAAEHAVEPGALDVEDLAAQRQDSLSAPVAPLLGRAASRISLDDEELRISRAIRLAVSQLAGQGHALEGAFAQDAVLGGFGGLAGLHGQDDLVYHGARILRILFEEGRERIAENRADRALGFHRAELGLGLALELDLAQFDRDDRGQALEGVIAGECLFALGEVIVLGIGVQDARQSRLEAGQVRAAFGRVDIVGEGHDARRHVIGILERDLDGLDAFGRLLDVEYILVHRLQHLVGEADERNQTALEIEGL